MTWDEYKNLGIETIIPDRLLKTNIKCPKCGQDIYMRTDIVLTSYPEQYQYECTCGWVGYSFNAWNIGMSNL